jgi:hypothetical protein
MSIGILQIEYDVFPDSAHRHDAITFQRLGNVCRRAL